MKARTCFSFSRWQRVHRAAVGRQANSSSVAYDKLDDPSSKTRIRLSSPLVRVENHVERVLVAYRRDRKTCGVRAWHCMLACNNAFIPALMPEIPAHQKEALAYPVKVPLVYTNVLLKQWTAFQTSRGHRAE